MIADMAAPMEQFGISNLETHKASFTKSEWLTGILLEMESNPNPCS